MLLYELLRSCCVDSERRKYYRRRTIRAVMDSETRELLILTLKVLRQTVETSRNTAEMAWQTWEALRLRDLIGFQEDFQSHKGVSFEHLHGLSESLIEQLDAAIRKLEK